MKSRYYKIVGLISLIVFLLWLNHSYLDIGPTQIKNWIASFGVFSAILYILLYTVRPLILFPASVLSLAGGLAFGALWGTIYTVLGATAGAVLSFLVARYFGKSLVDKGHTSKVIKIQDQMEKNGFLYVLLLRFIPLINFDLISYLAGVSNIRLFSFLTATFIGIIPGTFAYNFLGSSFVSGNIGIVITATMVFALIMVIPLLLRKKIASKLLINDEKEREQRNEKL